MLVPKNRPGFQRSNLLAVFGVIALLVAILFFFYAYGQKVNNKPAPIPQAEEQAVENLVEETKTKTYEELKEQDSALVTNPNVSNSEIKKKLKEENVIVSDPQNHNVIFDGEQFMPEVITIRQGDSVTFRNQSKQDLTVIGENEWGNKLPVPPTKAYTQGFDFKGEYRYSASTQPFPNGVIVVN